MWPLKLNVPNKKLILIVEDDSALRKLTCTNLEKTGYSVIEAEDGKTGLDMAIKHHPDLILLDLILPKVSGVEFMSSIVKDKWGKGAKVIILSNLSHLTNLSELYIENIYAYLVKNETTPDEIVRKVSEII